jgi:GGDEF domain-containing protein
LDEELLRARRYGHSLAVLRILVEDIPEVGKADAIQKSLRAAGQAIRRTLRKIDVTARLDKREFGAMLPFTGENSTIAARRVLEALQNSEDGLEFKGRIGVAFYPDQALTVATLLASADPHSENALVSESLVSP